MLQTKPVYVFKNQDIWAFTTSQPAKRDTVKYTYTFTGSSSNLVRLIFRYLKNKSSQVKSSLNKFAFSLSFAQATNADVFLETARSGLTLQILERDPNGYICKLRWFTRETDNNLSKIRFATGWLSNNLFDRLRLEPSLNTWLVVNVSAFSLD